MSGNISINGDDSVGYICMSKCNNNRNTTFGLKLKPGGKYIYRLNYGTNSSVTVTHRPGINNVPYNVTLNVNDDPNKPVSDVWNRKVTTLERNGNDLTVYMTPDTFGGFYGIHEFRIELGSGKDKDILEVFVYYDERPALLYIEQNQYACIKKNTTFTASIEKGTTMLVEWMIDKDNSTLYDYRDVDKVRLLNHTGIYDEIADIKMNVIAANEIAGVYKTFTIHVLYPINGFIIQSRQSQVEPGENITLNVELSENYLEPMGFVKVMVNYSDGQIGITPFILLKNREPLLSTVLKCRPYGKQGNITITVTLASQVDTMQQNIGMMVWNKINLAIKLNRTAWAVGEEVLFELVNTPEFGFRYHIMYGDKWKNETNNDDVLYLRNSITNLTHTYYNEGNYVVDLTVFNPIYFQQCQELVIIEYPVPKMVISPAKAIYPFPDGKVLFLLHVVQNVSVPKNAECTFVTEDIETMIVLNVTYGQPQLFEHTYSRNGTQVVNVTCTNAVSKRELMTTITLVAFHVDELKPILLQPLAVNDTTVSMVVTFSLNASNLARPPLNTSISWDFNDTTTVQNGTNWTKSHIFQEKGIYSVSATVSYNNVTKVIKFPLRLGIVLLLVNCTIGRVNNDTFEFTADVPPGSNLKLQLSFGDGEDKEVKNQDHVSHLYRKAGIYYPYLTGSNATFSEIMFLKTPMVVDYYIDTLLISMDEVISHPPGQIIVRLSMPEDRHDIWNLSCQLTFGDFFDHQTYNWTAVIEHGVMESYHYSYKTLGSHIVHVKCSNILDTKREKTNVTVINACFDGKEMFDRQHSFSHSPLVVYSHSRIVVRVRIAVICYDKDPVYQWTVKKSTVGNWEDVSLMESSSGSIVLKSPVFSAGLYRLSLNVSYGQLPDNWLSEVTYVQIIDAPLVAGIDGGETRVVSSLDILVDASALSYDPKLGMGKSDYLYFNWTCSSCSSSSVRELRRCQYNYTHVPCGDISKPAKNGVLLFLGSKVRHARSYLFDVRVSLGDRSSFPAKQLIQVQPGAPLVKIK